MDPDVAWYRTWLQRALVRRLAAESLFVAATAFAVVAAARPAGGLVAAATTAAAMALLTAVLRPVARRLAVRIEPGRDLVPFRALGRMLTAHGFVPVQVDEAAGRSVWMLADGPVLAVVDHGHVALVSRTSRGPILRTGTGSVPPTTAVVVQTLPSAPVGRLLEAHLRVLAAVHEHAGAVLPADTTLADQLDAELRRAREGVGGLGVFLHRGAGVEPRWACALAPDHAAVLALGMRRIAPVGGRAERFLAATP